MLFHHTKILITIDYFPHGTLHTLDSFIFLLEVCSCSSPSCSPFLPLIPSTLATPPPPPPIWFCFCSIRFVHLLCLLDSTYSWSRIDFAFLFLTHFTYHNTLLVHWLLKWQDFILLLWLSNIPLYVYKTHLYLFLYWWVWIVSISWLL